MKRKTAPRGKKLPTRELLSTLIERSLDDDKADDIVTYDLTGQSSLTDYMIIATGKSARQVSAMANHLREKLEARGKTVSVEGASEGNWVLVDAGDVVIHLFRPEVRAYYQLERLWEPQAVGTHT